MADKILVADHDSRALRLVCAMLEQQGYQVLQADTGAQLLFMAHKEKPNLVLMDTNLPDIEGEDIIRQLRKDSEILGILILVFSQKRRTEDKTSAFEAGADDYLVKPAHPAELTTRIKTLLDRVINPDNIIPGEKGHTIAFLAPKGGMGTSSLVLNTAIAYHKKTKNETIVCELRPGMGTMGPDLGYLEPQGLNNLLKSKKSELKLAAIRKELVKTPYGVNILMASPNPTDVELTSSLTQIDTLVNQLPLLASLVVLDIGANMLPNFRRILSLCKEIFLVTEPFPGVVQRTRNIMDQVADLGFGVTKPLSVVILNRLRMDVHLPISQVNEILGQNPVVSIPPVPEVAYQSAIRNMPIIQIQPEGLYTTQIIRLADVIIQHMQK